MSIAIGIRTRTHGWPVVHPPSTRAPVAGSIASGLPLLLPDRARPRPALHVALQGLGRLAHLGVAEVHLAVEVVGQPTVVVEPTQVRAAHVAHLQLLMARRARSVRQGAQVSFALLFRLLGLAHLEVLVRRARDAAFFAQDADLDEAGVDGLGEVRDLFQLHRLLVQLTALLITRMVREPGRSIWPIG